MNTGALYPSMQVGEYNLTEELIGTYLGKPLYRRVYQETKNVNTGNDDIVLTVSNFSSIDIPTVRFTSVTIYTSSVPNSIYNDYVHSSGKIWLDASGIHVDNVAISSSGTDPMTVTVVLEYCKK